ncbi:hypothetical protein BGX29_003410 [Mortierella sp. GBA35]|nr:hypothetical protein BGX29_003410 [Mortierella sp. GBA35]
MVLLKTTLLVVCLAASSSHNTLATPLQRISPEVGATAALVAKAPAANQVQGAHLLLDNDVDSKTPKNPVILLSKPRTYKDSQALCSAMGEKLASSSTPNLRKLLDTTPVAAEEVKRANRFWVSNPSSSSTKCMAFDRKNGRTIQLSCSIKLPALCINSLPRTRVGVVSDKSKQIKVKTPKAGTWQGYRDQNQFRFLGIPYAEPPIGRLRFQAPMRLNPRKHGGSKVNDATEFGFICTQLPFEADSNMTMEQRRLYLGGDQSEDCLHLNVFTPSLKANRAKGLPVMVYVHGGGYTVLSGSAPIFEPGNLVSRGGVVVVTLNYRLSIFGLFENTPAIPRSRAPGNLPTRDQIAALQWVHDNIAAFGGNPSQVTIFGESAGAWSMRALLSAPSSFGLYKNVIAQSDLMGLPFSSPEFAGDLGKLVLENLGCKSSDLACAQNKTTAQITAAQVKARNDTVMKPENSWVPFAAVFRPTVDKSLIPGDFAELVKSGNYNKKANIMWGYTKDEANLFIPSYFPNPVPLADVDKEFDKRIPNNRTRILIDSPYYKLDNSTDSVRLAFGEGATDYYWTCPTQIMSRGAAMQKSNVFAYRFDHGRYVSILLGIPPTSLCEGKVCHADDLIPSFGSGDVVAGSEQTGDDAQFARQVIDRFTTFAKTGNPNPNKTRLGAAVQNPDVTNVQWPKYDQLNPVFIFNLTNSSVSKNGDAGRCAWLDNNTQYDYQVHGPSGEFVPIYPPIPNPPATSTSTSTTFIQTPSSISGRPTTTNTLPTQTPITTTTTPPPTTSSTSSSSASGSINCSRYDIATTTTIITITTTTTATATMIDTTTTVVSASLTITSIVSSITETAIATASASVLA